MQTKFILASVLLICLVPGLKGIDPEKTGQDYYNPNATKNLNFGSVGVGYGTGFFCSSGFTHMYHVVGMSISMSALWDRAKDLPEDYTGFFRHDNMYAVSFRGVFGGNPDENGNAWVGIEIGPSYVNFRKEVETPNPDYGWWYLDKYLRDNLVFHTIGLSGRVKADFMFSDHVGMEIAFGFNLNRYKTTFGIESSFLFGRLK